MTNRNWAFTEAKRRAAALEGEISIYQKGDDYIIRTWEAAPPPAPHGWRLVATIQPDGTASFGVAS